MPRVIYMPNSGGPFEKPKDPPNIPLLVGGATGGLATVGVAISAKNWLWENKGKILLFILIVIAILVALWKAFTGDKGEEPEEE
jgi:hypothetical protein